MLALALTVATLTVASPEVVLDVAHEMIDLARRLEVLEDADKTLEVFVQDPGVTGACCASAA